jgi:hypothetical protein
MLHDLVVGVVYGAGHDPTGRAEEDIAALELLCAQFGRSAAVLRMIEAGEVAAHSWLVEMLRGYEKDQGEWLAGCKDAEVADRQGAFLASCWALLWRCEQAEIRGGED